MRLDAAVGEKSRQPLGRARFLAARRRNADQVAQQRDRIAVKSFRVHVRMSFHDRVFLRSASGAKAGVLLCFLLRFRGARARCRLELFSLRVCHVIDRQVSAFRLVFVLFLFLFFSPSLRHAGLVQVIRNLFCLVLGSCRFGRPLSVSGLPYGRFRIPSGAFCPFFSVLCSFPLCRGSLRSSRPQPAVPRLSFAPFPAGSVPDFGYAVIPLPTEKRDPVRFRNGPLRLAEESIASARTGMSGARLFSERYRPAMRRTGLSLSAGVRPRTA